MNEEMIIPDNSNATDSSFKTLSNLDVRKYTKGKNGHKFLSWAHAINALLAKYPNAFWDIREWEGQPFLKTDAGYFVQVDVHVNNIKRSQLHPVLDYRNKPITKPDAFQINTSIMRALTKAISLHGLGLYIYQGEDLPVNLRDGLIEELKDTLKSKNIEVTAAAINKMNGMNEQRLSEAIEKTKGE